MSEYLEQAKHSLALAKEAKNEFNLPKAAMHFMLLTQERIIAHLEQAAQTAESPAQSPATETDGSEQTVRSSRTTTASLLGAVIQEARSIRLADSGVTVTESTEVPTPRYLRLRRGLTEAERIHVAQCYECAGHLARYLVSSQTHAQDVAGTTSTSVKPDSPSSAEATPLADAPSPSSESSEPLTIRDAARDPSFVTEPERWDVQVRDNSQGQWKVEQDAAPSVSSDWSDEEEAEYEARWRGHFVDTPAPEPTQQDGAQSAASAEVWATFDTEHYLYVDIRTEDGVDLIAGAVERTHAEHIVALHNEAVR